MRFDLVRRALLRRFAFDDVRVERALREEVDRAQRARLLLEHGDELRPYGASLALRVRHAFEGADEPLRRVDVHEIQAEVALEHGADALRLLAPEQAVVNEDAGQLLADRLVDEFGGHCGVHAAGEGADDAPAADLLPDPPHALRDEVPRRPRSRRAAYLVGEVADDLRPVGRVRDLRVKLNAKHARVVRHRRDRRIVRIGDSAEARRNSADTVAVAHPNADLAVQPVEEVAGRVLANDGEAVLALARGLDAPPKLMRQQLHAVADAQHRNAAVERPRLRERRALRIDRRRPPGEDDALEVQSRDGVPGRVGRNEFAIDVLLADAPRDEPAVLRAVVNDGDRLRLQGRGRDSRRTLALRVLPLLRDAQVRRDFHVAAGMTRARRGRRLGFAVGIFHRLLSAVPSPAAFAASSPLIGRGGCGASRRSGFPSSGQGDRLGKGLHRH